MEMKVSFKYGGLLFVAVCDFTPGTPSVTSPPDDAYEGDPSECMILDLKHCDGEDANFLLHSDRFSDELMELACTRCEEKLQDEDRMSPPAGADV